MNPETAAKAAELYQASVLHWPQDHWLKENFAEFLESAEDLKAALVQRKRASELLPHDSMRTYEAGRLFALLTQWAEAEETLKAAVALRPRFTDAWVELGNVHFARQKFELALADYQRAAELEPLDVTYPCYVGKVFSRLNRHSEAVQRYRQAIQLQPDFWQAHFALADEMAAANKIAEAATAYADVVKLNPTNGLAHLDLGVMNARLGRLEEAQYEFQVTLQLEPGNAQAREYFERIRDRRNRQPSPATP
jgi:tetratricopeptide (TPR) repeat protein